MKKKNARVIQRILTLGPPDPTGPIEVRNNSTADPLPVAFVSGEKFALEVVLGARNTGARRAWPRASVA